MVDEMASHQLDLQLLVPAWLCSVCGQEFTNGAIKIILGSPVKPCAPTQGDCTLVRCFVTLPSPRAEGGVKDREATPA